MKLVLITSAFIASISTFAQSNSEDIFSETFENMFTSQVTNDIVALPQEVGNPAVPLDGGLTALLVAGGAVGYRKYRARSKKN